MAGSLFFAFTPAERIALDAVRDERPELMGALRERLAPVLEDLAQTCQGWVVTEFEAEDFLDRLRDEFVGRMKAELELWEDDEDPREPVVDLVTRRLLAEARDAFVRRLVAAKLD